MGDIGLKTESKYCHKCRWCARYNDYDALANTRNPVFYCTVGDFYSKRKVFMLPTFKKDCPCFTEPYNDDEEDN